MLQEYKLDKRNYKIAVKIKNSKAQHFVVCDKDLNPISDNNTFNTAGEAIKWAERNTK